MAKTYETGPSRQPGSAAKRLSQDEAPNRGNRLRSCRSGPGWPESAARSPTLGDRIGQIRDVGGTPDRLDVLAGYIVISAISLDAAAAVVVAERCPMLRQGGSVEVGEVIPAGSAS